MLLDVVLGYDCNLACTYCTIGPAMRPREADVARVAAEIDRAAREGFRDVAFTGGEPTIYPSLAPLVRRARRAGFEHAKVASNGLRYADPRYLDWLVEAGVDRFHVSVHAFGDAAYDATVRAPGAAKLRRAALAALVARGLDPVCDLILKEDTYRDVAAWIDALAALGVRRFALWLVSLTDANAANVEQLPRLDDVAPFVARACDEARAKGRDVVSLHVPRCFLPGFEDNVRHPGAEGVRVVTPDDVFDLRASRLSGGVKPAACRGCRFDADCPGLRADYVARFGDAVRPVS
ncbi:MAG TPA: radical SAM protein [Minicystis sp.]|nr:radical SAM protein [Minicystis sp.]